MHQAPALLKQLRERIRELSRSERKVADWVLAHPEETPRLNIAELSEFTQISEPTIIRFCRSVGCTGFQDFKLKLAHDLALGQDHAITFHTEDTVKSLQPKLLDLQKRTLSSLQEELNLTLIDTAITALNLAHQIVVCGYGSSAGLAQDTAYRLFQIIPRVSIDQDPHFTGLTCAHLKRGDVLLAICQTGNTRELFDHCLIAKRQEATLMSICPIETPIANIADLALSTMKQSDSGLMGVMIERTKQLIILDLIIAGLSLQRTTAKHKTPPLKQALRSHFIEQPDLVEQAKW